MGFFGFGPRDFRDSTADTEWRSRESLGGVLSDRLTHDLGCDFLSWAVARKPELHIAREGHYEFGSRACRYAKLFVYTNWWGSKLACGLYVESPKSGGGVYIHWRNFLRGLEHNPEMGRLLLATVTDHGLTIDLRTIRRRGDDNKRQFQFVGDGGKLYQLKRGRRQEVEFELAKSRITGIVEQPFHWANLHIIKCIPKRDAIAMGMHVFTPIYAVLRALGPLYLLTIAPPLEGGAETVPAGTGGL